MKGQVFTLKKMMMRAAMIIFAMLMTSTTAIAKVGDVLASGTCGENVTWTLTENGEKSYKSRKMYDGVTLTISGTGEITNRDYYQSESATGLFGSVDASASKFISTIIIGEGVTSIPNQAFWQFYNLHHVSLPSTLTTIGYGAFYNCDALKSIVIPDGVTQIQQQTFYSCDSLRSVTLGKGVKNIGQQAFGDCARLMTLRMKRYEPTDENNPITSFRGNDPFAGCVSLASLVLPEAGKTRYLEYEMDGETYYTEWDYTSFKNDNGGTKVFFRDLIRTDRETLFAAGTTNVWTDWTDKFNHAAPRGVEVYTIGSVEGRTVRLNMLTATVTLPEDERDGPGDDGVRPLIPAFTPVLIKRPSGTLTEDLKMQFVMGGELTPENGWYCSRSDNPSLWGQSGVYDNGAVSKGYVPAPVPDIMASVPYGYKSLSYNIWIEGATPSGLGDYIYGNIEEGFYWANVDKSSKGRCQSEVFNDDRASYFKLDGDQFRFFPKSEAAEDGIDPHHGTLSVTSGYLGGDLTSPLPLSINKRTEVTLPDNGTDNTAAIAAAASTMSNRVTLSGRTFYLDGGWNTLCLPFDEDFYTLTSIKPDFFISFYVNHDQDAIVMELDTEGTYDGHQTGFDDTDGTLYLYFKQAYAIKAGKPYLVKWKNRFGSVSNPVFYDAKFVYVPPTPDLIINSVSDWNTFAQSVNNGTNYYKKLVMLNADIDGVTTMAGTSNKKFWGTFDGNGHTLNLALTGSASCTAPFSYAEGATIKNLRTTGTVTLSDASYYHASGLVGSAQRVTIENCHVSVAIQFPDGTSTVYSGGIIGHSGSDEYTMTNCLFDGSIGYVSGGTGTMENVGGLVGWGDNSTPHITYCLNAGTFANPAGLAMIARGQNSGTIYKCYSTTNTTENGRQYIDAGTYTEATGSDLLALLGDGWEMSGGEVVPVMRNYDLNNPPTTNISSLKPVSFPGGQFLGTYDQISYNATNTSILFLGPENSLYYPKAGASIGAFRAYFQLNDGSAVKEFKLIFDAEDDTDGIRVIDNGQLTIDNEDSTLHSPLSGWYDLSGRRLDGKPTQRGIYINNGKKVIIN